MAAALWRRCVAGECVTGEGRSEAHAAAVGRCVGHLVALHAVSLGPEHTLSPPLARWLAASPVALTSAGRVRGPLRILELRAGLGAREGQAALQETWAALRAPVPDGSFAQSLDEGHAFLLSALRFTSLAALARPASPWAAGVHGPVADAIEKGRAHLAGAGGFPGSWEHQRWGLADDARPLVGRAYIQATILGCLRDAGDPDAEERLAQLVAALPAAPLRYYEAWDRLPPDADSLGLFLLVDAESGGATDSQRAAWRAPLRPSLRPDGTAPTWLTEGPHGPTTPEPRWTWGGDDCSASRTMLLRGLIAQGRPGDMPLVHHNLHGILSGHARGEHGSFYYELPWARVLLQRLQVQAGASVLPDELRAALDGTLEEAREQVAREQRSDGGWGSPLRTAMNLEVLSGGTPPGLALERGLRYLCDTQGPDGSWASEPFFLTIGKPPYPEHPHGGPELTTALCLSAAARALRSLRGDTHGHD
jgi:hypothetical protein